MRWLTAVVVMTGCGAAQLEHVATFDFADVALGQSRTSTLQVVNHGPGAAVLELLSEGDEFTLEETSRTLAEGEVFAVRVTFTPADLGPRMGSLLIRRGAASSTVALSGRGTGPRLSVRNVVTLAPIATIDGQPLPVIEVPLVISNVGTTGSQLHVSLSANDNEVCVGSFDAIGACAAWIPPPSLRAGERVTVPLSLLPTAEGVRTWRVTVSSDDPVTRAQVVTLSAVVERFVPCSFTGPFQVLLDAAPVPVTLTHHGAGPCLVRTVTIDSRPAGAFVLAAPVPQVPVRVPAGGQFTAWVGSSPRAPRTAEGSLHVMSASGADREVHLSFQVVAPRGCLVMSPAQLDFGTARTGCAAASSTAQLFNACATPITLESVRVTSGPFVISNFPSVPTIGPGQSLLLPVRYTPLAAGPETGVISVVVKDAETQVLALEGRGELATPEVDTFRDDPWPVVDVLVMVDTSPSIASKRAAVRANLAAWLSSRFFTCIDARWAFAPADGAPDAGVAFALNDAGSAWTSRLESDFVGRALAAFDALPSSSETEACIGPAAALMQNVPARDGGHFSGLCVTDALEQSPTPLASLQQLQAQFPSMAWSAVTGVASSTCAVEAPDDGVHASLVQASHGLLDDVCASPWFAASSPIGLPTCGLRSTYYLNNRPEPGTLEVRVDGVIASPSSYSFDALGNAVAFDAAHTPRPGSTIELRYTRACGP